MRRYHKRYIICLECASIIKPGPYLARRLKRHVAGDLHRGDGRLAFEMLDLRYWPLAGSRFAVQSAPHVPL